MGIKDDKKQVNSKTYNLQIEKDYAPIIALNQKLVDLSLLISKYWIA